MSGKVRIDLPRDFTTEHELRLGDRMPKLRRIVVSSEEYEELAAQIRDEDPEKAELRRAFERACDELDEWKRKAYAPDVDELKAVIVSQAREIARLKGESE